MNEYHCQLCWLFELEEKRFKSREELIKHYDDEHGIVIG